MRPLSDDSTPRAGPKGRLPDDFHVSVDFESLIRDAVRLHRSRVLEPPHLDHLDHELDFAILPLVEAQSDHAVRDVFHEAVAGGPRVFVLYLRGEDARGPAGLELLAEGKELLPPFRVVREEHVQQADRVDRDAGGAAPFDEIRELGADSRDGRLRVDGLELHDVEFLLLQISFQVPAERRGVRDHGIDVFLEGDVNRPLSVDQALHQELQRERGLAGPERTEDRDDVPRGHASTEHLVEPIDPGEDEPFLDPFVRCIPLIVVTRSLTSTRSEIARSVRESMTTIESCAFSSRKATSSSRMFVAGRSNTSSCSVHDAGTTLCRKYVLEKSLKTVWSRNAR